MPGVRSLADDLRGRSDEQLAALLLARPDLARPAPADLSALAARATTRTSIQRALDGLDLAHLHALEAVVVASPASAEEVSTLLATDEDLAGELLTHLHGLALLQHEQLAALARRFGAHVEAGGRYLEPLVRRLRHHGRRLGHLGRRLGPRTGGRDRRRCRRLQQGVGSGSIDVGGGDAARSQRLGRPLRQLRKEARPLRRRHLDRGARIRLACDAAQHDGADDDETCRQGGGIPAAPRAGCSSRLHLVLLLSGERRYPSRRFRSNRGRSPRVEAGRPSRSRGTARDLNRRAALGII